MWSHAHIYLLGLIGPKLVIRSQTLGKIDFIIFDSLNRVIEILVKLRSCLQKSGLQLWSYPHICLLGPIGPKLVIMSQTLEKIDFLIFDSLYAKSL